MFVAKAEGAKGEALLQTPSTRLKIWRFLMAIIVCLRDENLSYNSVKVTQKACFLVVAESGFGPGINSFIFIHFFIPLVSSFLLPVRRLKPALCKVLQSNLLIEVTYFSSIYYFPPSLPTSPIFSLSFFNMLFLHAFTLFNTCSSS